VVKTGLITLLVILTGVPPLAAEQVPIEFEPKIGVIGTKVIVKTRPPAGARARLGDKAVTISEESPGVFSFVVPVDATTSFLEYVHEDRTAGRSAVPLIVTGRSLVLPRLAGLRESIDVFAYSDPKPSGGERPEPKARPFLSLDDQEIFTLGESAPELLIPAVEVHDAASAATRSMTGTFLILTVRLPGKRLRLRIPPPVPTPAPESSDCPPSE
jgi:hypothetical protein